MSTYSQSYPVKSNAARAAIKYGLTRADLEQCDDGWRFMIPDAAAPATQEARTEDYADQAPKGWDKVETTTEDAPIVTMDDIEARREAEDAAAESQLSIEADPSYGDPREPIEAAPVADPIELEAVTLAELADTAEGQANAESWNQVPTIASNRKRARKPKAEGRWKPGAKAHKAPKASGNVRKRQSGLGAQVVAELKARWTPIDSLVKMTGWEPHTTRAFISVQSRKLGLTAERKRVEGITSYRMVA